MCILYALKIWKRLGGKLIFTFQPGFHVMVCTPKGIFHGTNKSHDGRWRIEQLDAKALARWFKKMPR